MPPITDNIRPELTRLLPSALLSEVKCFVFYDNHPRDNKNIDIIIGTSNGEIKEFFKRDLVNSMNLQGRYQPTDLKLLRNGNCELFYLVVAGDELTIISRKETLDIHCRVSNVERYGIEDSGCRGQAGLKVIIKDDAVPLVFDDNFVNLGDKAFMRNGLYADDSLPLLTELMRKLTQTKYSVKCNEKILKQFMGLRQASALASYQKIHPNTEDSAFNTNSSKENEVLKVRSLTPWVRMCNKKLVIVFTVTYTNVSVPIEDIHILLHGTNQRSMIYTTKLYEKTKVAPFWEERGTQSLLNDHEIAVVTIIDMDEIVKNYLSKIEFSGVISYKRLGMENVMPFNHVILSSVEVMGEGFDALAGINIEDDMLSLAIVATTLKTKLLLRHMRRQNEGQLVIPDAFCTYLHMARVENIDNIVIFKHSPYHVMNGLMVTFLDEKVPDDCNMILVYARSPGHVVALMNFIHDAIPHKIVITTPSIKFSPKLVKPSRNADEPPKTFSKVDYDYYAQSIINQSNMLMEYYDKCMAKMSESKDMNVISKIGTEVDIFAEGLPSFMEFRRKMQEEALKGMKSLKTDNVATVSTSTTRSVVDNMVMD